jgi:putative FmdB family regulatory protein
MHHMDIPHTNRHSIMPIYDYRCNDCGTTYDIFHKVREVAEDVVCPSCNSVHHTRLIGAPSFSMSGKGSAAAETPSCANGSCCGGACGLD